MRLAIMQPYFLPYIGYFQLISAADLFVVYDNIKYTKKGWINRNRMLLNGKDAVFSLPLRQDSDSLDVAERELAASFDPNRLLNQFKGAYSHAPYFVQTFSLLEQIVGHEDHNLFRFIHNAIILTCRQLGITTEIRVSSEINVDRQLKGQERVIALCRALGADTYINPIGGVELYSPEQFKISGVDLRFLQVSSIEYRQFDNVFVPWLSIIDAMMFSPLDLVSRHVRNDYVIAERPSNRLGTKKTP